MAMETKNKTAEERAARRAYREDLDRRRRERIEH